MIKIILPIMTSDGNFINFLGMSQEVGEWLKENNIRKVQFFNGETGLHATLHAYFEHEDEAILFRLRFGV